MSVSGLCQVCRNAEARHRCEGCGSLVCDAHYEEPPGLCVDCASAGGGRRL